METEPTDDSLRTGPDSGAPESVPAESVPAESVPAESVPASDEPDLFFAARRKSLRRTALAAIAAMVIVPMLLGVWIFWTPIERWLRGETSITGDPTFTYRPSESELDGLERIHADELPTWVIAEANRKRWGDEHAETSYSELVDALDDPNLIAIVDEAKTIVRADEQVQKAERLDYLMRSWSNYMSERDEPYFVQGNVLVSSTNSFFYVKTYRVASDVRVTVADQDYRSRLVRRLDSTNVRESYLGSTSKGADGAVILLDRLYEFALRDIWPLLDPVEESSSVLQLAFQGVVQDNVERALPEPDRAALVSALEPWRELHAVLDTIEGRHACGSSLRISEPGHRGLAPDTLAQLQRWATDDPLALCPAITDDELKTLRDLSQELRENDDLDRAIGALVAWLGRGISIHEARHVADDVQHDGLETPLACSVCDDRTSVPTRAELSAYLASFAWGATPNTTFFQACVATDGRRGPHARAMQLIQDGLQHDCADGPVEDLNDRARALEAEWFGRSERVTVPADYPRVVDVAGLRR